MHFYHKIKLGWILLAFAMLSDPTQAETPYLDWYSNAQLKTLRATSLTPEKIPQLSLCGGSYWEPERKNLELSAPIPKSVLGSAQSYEYSQDRAVLQQEVIIQQDPLQVESDQVLLNFADQKALFSGNIRFRAPGFLLSGEQASLNLETQQADFAKSAYLVHSAQVRGEAHDIHLNQAGDLTIHRGTYTGCQPGSNDWHFYGQQIQIDRTAGWGSIQNMALFLGPVPILYSPYFTFPLDERRQTGLLYPTIYNLAESDIGIPFYWNIAPNYDATLEPRLLGARGILWNNEFRFLNPTLGQGQINVARLADDSEYHHQNRDSIQWQQHSYWQDRWALQVDYNRVSDTDYLDDFGHNLSMASAGQLNQSAQLSYAGDNWRWQAQVQANQTIDAHVSPQDYPYRQLPKINVETNHPLKQWQNSRVNWKNQWEYAYFEQPTANHYPKVQRAHWESQVGYTFENSWAFSRPQLSLLNTEYVFEEGHNNTLHRTLPRFDWDSKLYFQRPVTFSHQTYQQTLEPRLFYLYVPYQNQSAIPILDSSALNFDLAQLYRLNRFSGLDRIGDSNRLSLSLTSHLYSAEGRSLISSSLGQVLFQRAPQIQLTHDDSDNKTPIHQFFSSTQIEWNANTRSIIDFQWNPADKQIDTLRSQFQWHPDANHVFNANYRFRRATTDLTALEQSQLSFAQPLTNRWRILNAWQYDFNERHSLEYLSGFEYTSCCWRSGLVIRQRLSETDTTDVLSPRYALLFTIELKGLSQLGDDLEKTLAPSIPGLKQSN